METGEKKLAFYKRIYNQIEKLEKIYMNYNLDKIKIDLISSEYILNKQQKEEEFASVTSLESVLLATLIGLNREKLEQANSNTKERSLFQYKDYKSTMQIFSDEINSENGFEVAEKMCDFLNFNPEKKGPFPHMLEIIKDDNKNRPYDYISKIRNALLHSEYYLEDYNVLHIMNHDEDKNLVFEGRLLMFPFAMFVIDFFGINGVNSSFSLYNILSKEEFETMDDIADFFKNLEYMNIKFLKIPDSYKFKGQDGLYSKLNSCFGLNSNEMDNKDIIEQIIELEKEGLEYQVSSYGLSDSQIINIYQFMINKYGTILKDKEVVNYLKPIVKLQLNPMDEIANCLGNMITYISCKKDVLVKRSGVENKFLEELKYDKYCNTAFKYALTILKTNVINYALECDEFCDIDLSGVDTKFFNTDDYEELERRRRKLIMDGDSEDEVHQKIFMQTIRNALSHGDDRIKVSIEEDLKVYFIDKYHNTPNLGVEINLEDLNNILSMDIFKPENIKLKQDQVLKKTK